MALFEHLVCLGEKFDALSKEEISDYEEMESKITSIVKEFCTLQYMDESVCWNRIHSDSLSAVVNKKFFPGWKHRQANDRSDFVHRIR